MTDPLPHTGLRSAGLLWIIAPLWYVLAEAITAAAFPGYSYARFYISDLGVPEVVEFQGRPLNSPLHAVMNGGFIGTGLLFLIGLVLVAPMLRRGWAQIALLVLGVVHAIGIVLVGLVPGSVANVENGLIAVHGIGAVAAIAGGNLAAICSVWAWPRIGGRHWYAPGGRLGVILGGFGLISAVVLVTHVLVPDGVSERGAVYAFMLWQFLAGIALWRTPSPTAEEPAADIVTP